MTSPGPGYNYVAVRELRINGIIAFETGMWVPDSTIASQGWSVGTDVSAPGAVTPTAQLLTSINFGDYTFQPPASYTYNPDGTVATATENSVTTAYTYNADGTVHTATRSGVTRTYSYNADGTVSGVA
jgi:hypothetical protein